MWIKQKGRNMEEKKRVGYINNSPQGLWGSLNWDGTKLFIRNVRDMGSGMKCADVQSETGETFLNKAGKVCKRYANIGAIRYTAVSGDLVMQLDGKQVREEFGVSVKNGNQGQYVLLSFADVNPFMAMFDEKPQAAPAQSNEIPDVMPF